MLQNYLNEWNNVAAGQTAVLNISKGPSYRRITIPYSGVTLAQMKRITVNANGKPIMFFNTGETLDYLNKYYGRPVNAGEITIYFDRPEMNALRHQRATILGTLDLSTLSITIDIDAAAAAPVLSKPRCIKAAPDAMRAIVKIKEYTWDASAAGDFELSSIPCPDDHRVMAMHFFKADVNELEVELTQNTLFQKLIEGTKTELENLQKEFSRVPQTAVATHWDMCLEGDMSRALLLNSVALKLQTQDFRQRLTLGSAGAGRVVVEYLAGYQGL